MDDLTYFATVALFLLICVVGIAAHAIGEEYNPSKHHRAFLNAIRR